jgi:hypothetical protein
MEKKGIIVQWESRAKTSPTGRSWRLPPFDDVLENWRVDPDVFTPKNRAFYVRGKDRHLVTTQEATERRLNHAIAEANPAAHASAIALEEPSAAAAPPPEIDLEPVMLALIDVCKAGDKKDAKRVWDTALAACGARMKPEPLNVAEMVRAIGAEWRQIGNRAPINSELVRKKIGARVEAWIVFTRDEAQQATGTRGASYGYSPGDPRAPRF